MNILACRPFNVVYVPEYLGQGKVMGGHGTQDKEKSQKSTIPLWKNESSPLEKIDCGTTSECDKNLNTVDHIL